MQNVFGGLGSFSGLLLPVLFFIAMYFLVIAPNQKKQRTWQDTLGKVKAGDQVTTAGGLRGTVLSVRDEVVTLRVAPDNLRLECLKSALTTINTADEG